MDGNGKSLSLAHVIHYCHSAGWFILPVPRGNIFICYNNDPFSLFHCISTLGSYFYLTYPYTLYNGDMIKRTTRSRKGVTNWLVLASLWDLNPCHIGGRWALSSLWHPWVFIILTWISPSSLPPSIHREEGPGLKHLFVRSHRKLTCMYLAHVFSHGKLEMWASCTSNA